MHDDPGLVRAAVGPVHLPARQGRAGLALEFAFTKYPLRGRALHSLATVKRGGKADHEVTIDVKLPRRRPESCGEGLIVRLRASGKPRLSGLGFTKSRGDCRHLAGVIGLDAADRDQRVAACSQRIDREILIVRTLLPPYAEARVAVLSLGPDLDFAAKVLAETLESVDRRRAEERLHAVERFQAHGSSPCESLFIDCSIRRPAISWA